MDQKENNERKQGSFLWVRREEKTIHYLAQQTELLQLLFLLLLRLLSLLLLLPIRIIAVLLLTLLMFRLLLLLLFLLHLALMLMFRLLNAAADAVAAAPPTPRAGCYRFTFLRMTHLPRDVHSNELLAATDSVSIVLLLGGVDVARCRDEGVALAITTRAARRCGRGR